MLAYIPYMDPMGYCILFDIMGFPQPLLHTMCLTWRRHVSCDCQHLVPKCFLGSTEIICPPQKTYVVWVSKIT